MLLPLLLLPPPPQPDRTMPATITSTAKLEKNIFRIESSNGRRDQDSPFPTPYRSYLQKLKVYP